MVFISNRNLRPRKLATHLHVSIRIPNHSNTVRYSSRVLQKALGVVSEGEGKAKSKIYGTDARHPNYLKGNTAASHTLPCVRRAPVEPFDASRGKSLVTHCRLDFPSLSRNSEVHRTRKFYASVNSTELGHRTLSTAAVLVGCL
jgi:hypothetical protein